MFADRRRSNLVGALSVLVVAVAAAPAFAAVIRGSAKNDNIHGTAKNDVISGLHGNDRLYGFRGNDRLLGGPGRDYLSGGPGNDVLLGGAADDVLVGGPGDDTFRCGAGRDKVIIEAVDANLSDDCEVLVDAAPAPPIDTDDPPYPEPPTSPPPPTEPPAVPVIAGAYRGATNTGDHVFFDVGADRAIRNFRANDMREFCDDGSIVYGALNVGPYPIGIDANGDFRIEYDSDGTVGGVPAKFHVRIAGHIQGAVASGTALIRSEFVWDGRRLSCSTELKTWTASLLS